jgi:hypothetical protein
MTKEFKLKKINRGDKSKIMIVDEIVDENTGNVRKREILCNEKSVEKKIQKLEEEVNSFKEVKNKIQNEEFDEEITESVISDEELEFNNPEGGTKIDELRPEGIKRRERPNRSKKDVL